MALFGKKEAIVSKDSAIPSAAGVVGIGCDLSAVLKHARITEKATMHSSDGVYTFDIAKDATKRDVIQSVYALYKVLPRKVRIVKVPTKMRRNPRTGKTGITRGGKKAYVYLKKGETITIG